MDPDTFITEVSREIPGEAMLKQYFEQLNTNIAGLDDRLGYMLKRHENDFFTAFKSHLFQLPVAGAQEQTRGEPHADPAG
jgi:hypothetical protein